MSFLYLSVCLSILVRARWFLNPPVTFEKLRRSTESATHSFEVLVCLSVGLKAVGSAGGVGSADLSRELSTDRQSILIKDRCAHCGAARQSGAARLVAQWLRNEHAEYLKAQVRRVCSRAAAGSSTHGGM